MLELVIFILKNIFIGAMAGYVSGFFGAGGGVILVIASELTKNGKEKDIFAQTAFVTAVFSAVSAVSYFKSGVLAPSASHRLIIPSALGGAVGALLLDRIPHGLLRRVFGTVSVVGGIIMMLR